VALFALACAVPAQTTALTPAAQPAYESNPKFTAQMDEAAKCIKTRQYLFAVEAYKIANAGHSLSKHFGVEAIPHYFTIDSDGVLTAEMLGSGSDVEGKLKKLIARAKAAKPASNEVAADN
jgi:hypothetical protein